MTKRRLNSVRVHRTRHKLSTTELARLIGRDRTLITRLEQCGRTPGCQVALALQIIFGTPPREMFVGLYEEVEESVMRQAVRMHERLAGRTDLRSQKKLDLLRDMMNRATVHDPRI